MKIDIAELQSTRNIVERTLIKRHNSAVVRGWSVATSTFFYSIYTAKTTADFDNALMAKGKLYIQLYRKEHIKECSAFGITTIAHSLPVLEKRYIIQELCTLNFTPTPRDKELAFLEWWKRIPTDKLTLLYYASTRNLGVVPRLPQDLIVFIAKLIEKPLF
jgi:hypothetical protein